jgi:hypothetical protein
MVRANYNHKDNIKITVKVAVLPNQYYSLERPDIQ